MFGKFIKCFTVFTICVYFHLYKSWNDILFICYICLLSQLYWILPVVQYKWCFRCLGISYWNKVNLLKWVFCKIQLNIRTFSKIISKENNVLFPGMSTSYVSTATGQYAKNANSNYYHTLLNVLYGVVDCNKSVYMVYRVCIKC